ncbi:hypothetical protein PJN34_23345 [Mycobacterium kansasii]
MATIAIGLLVTVIVYEPHRTGTKTVSPSALSDVLLSSQEAAKTLSGEPVQDKLAATAIVDEDCAGVVTRQQKDGDSLKPSCPSRTLKALEPL